MAIASQPFSLNLVITEPTKLPLAIDGSEISGTKEQCHELIYFNQVNLIVIDLKRGKFYCY